MDEAQRREGFRTLYEAAYPHILGYALRRAPAPEDAADVVSETFLAAWRRFDEMPRGDESLLWLYGVVHRLLANQHRGALRRSALSDRLAEELGELARGWHDPLPSDLAPLACAWWRLRAQDRELLGFVAWEGLSHAELSRLLGCSRTVVKLRLHRARRRFAAELAKAGVEVDAALGDAKSPAAPAESCPPRSEAGASRWTGTVAAAGGPGLKPPAAVGHVPNRRASARPGREELS